MEEELPEVFKFTRCAVDVCWSFCDPCCQICQSTWFWQTTNFRWSKKYKSMVLSFMEQRGQAMGTRYTTSKTHPSFCSIELVRLVVPATNPGLCAVGKQCIWRRWSVMAWYQQMISKNLFRRYNIELVLDFQRESAGGISDDHICALYVLTTHFLVEQASWEYKTLAVNYESFFVA